MNDKQHYRSRKIREYRENEILPPKKKIHPEIYLNYVKAKTENIEKAKCGGRMDITDKRAEELE